MRRIIFAAILFTCAFSGGQVSASPIVPDRSPFSIEFERYYRSELYFGRSIPGGGTVSDDEWEQFLADVVTPRFPDGFTIMKATGQYREKDGTIDKEPSEVLVFFYPVRSKTASRRRIEEIRRAYVRQFKQESVLRLDFPSTVDVKF